MILPRSFIRYSAREDEIQIGLADVLKFLLFGVKDEKIMKKHIDK